MDFDRLPRRMLSSWVKRPPGAPRTDGHVRMNLFCGGYKLAPAPPALGGADATYKVNVTCLDPAGSIPSAVVRRTAAQRGSVRSMPMARDSDLSSATT